MMRAVDIDIAFGRSLAWHSEHARYYSVYRDAKVVSPGRRLKAFAEACLCVYGIGDNTSVAASPFYQVLRSDAIDGRYVSLARRNREDVLLTLMPLALAKRDGWPVEWQSVMAAVWSGGDVHYPRALYSCCGLWLAYRVLGASNCPYTGDALWECGPLRRPTRVSLQSWNGAYSIAHYVMYLTDFGRALGRFDDPLLRVTTGAIVNALLARMLCVGQLDAAVELAIAGECIAELDEALAGYLVGTIAEQLGDRGYVAGVGKKPGRGGGSGDHAEDTWAKHYHTMLVSLILLGMLVRRPWRPPSESCEKLNHRWEDWRALGMHLNEVYDGTEGDVNIERDGACTCGLDRYAEYYRSWR